MAQYRLGGKGRGAAPRGRQLVQDYVLCTAPPLTFMALPFGGCGCSVAPFFPRPIPLPYFFSRCCCLCYLPYSAYTWFFDSACQKAIKSCAGIKLFTWKIASKTPNCAQQTMQGGKTRLPPPLSPTFFPLLFKYSFNELNVWSFFAASTSIRTSIPLKWHLQFPFTCHTANQLVAVETFTWRMRNQSWWQRQRRRWLMRFAADLSTSWLMENANMKLSKN